MLFICSQNKLRSPTAENIFSRLDGFKVLSAGLNHDAEIAVTPELIEWSDYIFVMETNHRNKLKKRFKKYINDQKIVCLNIPDNYNYMNDELIIILKSKVMNYFNNAKLK